MSLQAALSESKDHIARYIFSSDRMIWVQQGPKSFLVFSPDMLDARVPTFGEVLLLLSTLSIGYHGWNPEHWPEEFI